MPRFYQGPTKFNNRYIYALKIEREWQSVQKVSREKIDVDKSVVTLTVRIKGKLNQFNYSKPKAEKESNYYGIFNLRERAQNKSSWKVYSWKTVDPFPNLNNIEKESHLSNGEEPDLFADEQYDDTDDNTDNNNNSNNNNNNNNIRQRYRKKQTLLSVNRNPNDTILESMVDFMKYKQHKDIINIFKSELSKHNDDDEDCKMCLRYIAIWKQTDLLTTAKYNIIKECYEKHIKLNQPPRKKRKINKLRNLPNLPNLPSNNSKLLTNKKGKDLVSNINSPNYCGACKQMYSNVKKHFADKSVFGDSVHVNYNQHKCRFSTVCSAQHQSFPNASVQFKHEIYYHSKLFRKKDELPEDILCHNMICPDKIQDKHHQCTELCIKEECGGRTYSAWKAQKKRYIIKCRRTRCPKERVGDNDYEKETCSGNIYTDKEIREKYMSGKDEDDDGDKVKCPYCSDMFGVVEVGAHWKICNSS